MYILLYEGYFEDNWGLRCVYDESVVDLCVVRLMVGMECGGDGIFYVCFLILIREGIEVNWFWVWILLVIWCVLC